LKILILKPSSLGDVVQALPVLRLLKRHLPDSQIDWWIDSRLVPLLEGDPDLHQVIRFERQRWASPVHWPEMLRSIAALRMREYDWVIDLQCLMRSGLFAWLAKGTLLAGLDEPREGARGFYDIVVPRASFHTHAVDWYLAVLPHLGVPVDNGFVWLPERPQVAADIKAKWNPAPGRWIALQPGARWKNKRWPVEHFADLARKLAADDTQVQFAVFGSKEEQSLAETVCSAVPDRCVNLAGQTSLAEMIEWLRRCDLMVTNDTGPMHVAAALGKPVIGVFGPTEPRRTGPYGQLENVIQHRLPCAPCFKSRCAWHNQMECLRAITPSEVVKRAHRELERTP
jgi:heptosyltransferase-1